MFCPLCPCTSVGFIGGWIGSYITGYHPPKDNIGRLISYGLTSASVGITFIALKIIWNIPMCGGAGSLLGKVINVLIKGIILGIIYSVPINILLGKYRTPHCCKSKDDSEGEKKVYFKFKE